jgi:hypothetical protein
VKERFVLFDSQRDGQQVVGHGGRQFGRRFAAGKVVAKGSVDRFPGADFSFRRLFPAKARLPLLEGRDEILAATVKSARARASRFGGNSLQRRGPEKYRSVASAYLRGMTLAFRINQRSGSLYSTKLGKGLFAKILADDFFAASVDWITIVQGVSRQEAIASNWRLTCIGETYGRNISTDPERS